MYERAILHLDLDAFFASVEVSRDRSLRGKPVIIGGSKGRGVVASCTYEARRFGIHSAMPMRMALQRCPDAIVIRGDMEAYRQRSQLITDIIAAEAPLFEKASIDEFYLDLTGMDRHFGCWQWSRELRQKIMTESGLPLSLGLSVNKLLSKVTTNEVKPNGQGQVPRGEERAFLAPLSVAKLPSVGKATYKKLSFMGVRTVRTLRKIPLDLLEREFGKHGASLWQKARGIDERPVVPYREAKSLSTEQTFQVDTIDVRALKDRLTGMVGKLAFELRQAQKLTSCITIKIRYTDFNTYTKQQLIPHTANDTTLLHHAHHLFNRLYERRQLLRLVGLRFSGLVTGHPQINLFDDTIKDVQLLQQLDRIRQRFGPGAIKRASTL
ncbi:MAG: DNA polymerase IV [Bacteroidota bacterium]